MNAHVKVLLPITQESWQNPFEGSPAITQGVSDGWPLSESEVELLRAAMDRVIPRDQEPSATDLGGEEFIRRRLVAQPEIVELYRTGLEILEGSGFGSADEAHRDAALSILEEHAFVRLLIQHTVEAYYSDPGNGGNRDGASWKAIGFEVTA